MEAAGNAKAGEQFSDKMKKQTILLTFLNLTVAFALQTLHIGVLLPFSGLTEREKSMKGNLIQPAVYMALKDIESQAILPEYHLQLHINDTQVRMSQASSLKINLSTCLV